MLILILCIWQGTTTIIIIITTTTTTTTTDTTIINKTTVVVRGWSRPLEEASRHSPVRLGLSAGPLVAFLKLELCLDVGSLHILCG
jgi:hypothetical protein